MNTYHSGQQIRLQTVFDVDGALTDPTTITFKLRVPAGTVTTYIYGTDAQLKRSSAGVYYVDYLTVNEGEHSFRFIGTGACIAANEQKFIVLDSAFQ